VFPENIHTLPPQGRPLEILRGWVVSKAKIHKGKYEAKLDCGRGGGSNKKKHLWRGDGYFLEHKQT